MNRPLSPRVRGALQSFITGDIKPNAGSCPCCGTVIESSGAAIRRPAQPGDLGVCTACIGLYQFGPDLTRRALSESDLATLPSALRRDLTDTQASLRAAHASRPS